MASDGRIGLDLDLWVKLLVKKKKKKVNFKRAWAYL